MRSGRPATPDAHPSVQARSVRKSYGRIRALDGVELALDGAAIVGLVGPNGAGKTTLINVLLGLEGPDAGEVRVFGRQPAALFDPGGPRVGFMPQGLAIYEDLTIRENVAFFAHLHRVPRARRNVQVEAAVAMVGLGDRIDDRVATLSGGMQRRVSLAASLVHEPEFVVLDEPTVGVDPDLRAQMWQRFRELRNAGTLLVMSTHYLGEASRCDRVVFMRHGRVMANDTPQALLDATGADDLEDAFLEIAGRTGVVA